MKTKIPVCDWPTALANAIVNAADGDVIIVATEAQKELGQHAKERMCPEKDITLEIESAPDPEIPDPAPGARTFTTPGQLHGGNAPKNQSPTRDNERQGPHRGQAKRSKEMLTKVRNPKLDDIKLTKTDSDIIVTASGWTVRSFAGDDGNTYERAEKNSRIKWFRV